MIQICKNRDAFPGALNLPVALFVAAENRAALRPQVERTLRAMIPARQSL
jgi:hypothetical protein